MSLRNGRYLQYETKLRDCLTQMDYKGEYLTEIDVGELIACGVYEYRDAKILYKDIQVLIKTGFSFSFSNIHTSFAKHHFGCIYYDRIWMAMRMYWKKGSYVGN